MSNTWLGGARGGERGKAARAVRSAPHGRSAPQTLGGAAGRLRNLPRHQAVSETKHPKVLQKTQIIQNGING